VTLSRLLLGLLAMLYWAGAGKADPVVLRLPVTPSGNHVFYHELLVAAFDAAGMPVEVQVVEGPIKLRLSRMLTRGDITILWMVRSETRDKQFVPVPVPLTGGLIGQRLLLIRPEDQPRFDKVRSLEDLRKLGMFAGMGRDWVDRAIWAVNGLPATAPTADWRLLYGMLEAGNRDVDYIPRGITEIVAEAGERPTIAVEKRLILQYARDQQFYVSPEAAFLAPALERGLIILQRNGTFAALQNKHFGYLQEAVDMRNRLVLTLQDAPEMQTPQGDIN
jgi:hypothetical protein